jgi:hypothetical protein
MEISIQGVVKVNFELTIDENVFNEACDDCGLDSKSFKTFSNDDWDMLNKHLIQAVRNNEDDIIHNEIYDSNSVWADTLTINDRKNMTTVYYDQKRNFDSVEIL